MAARTASRDTRAPSPPRNSRNTDRPPRALTAASMASGRGSLASASVARNSARVSSSIGTVETGKPSSRGSASPEPAKRSIKALVQPSARSTRRGPISAAAAAITVLGELPASSRRRRPRLRGRRRAFDLGGDGDIEQRAVVRVRDLVDKRQGKIGLEWLKREVEDRMAVQVGHLRRRIHERSPEASFMFWRGMTAPTCRASAWICVL